MVYFMEHSIKEINEKEQAGGTSAEDKAKIEALEQEVNELTSAIERGLNT